MSQCKSCDKESDYEVPQCKHVYCLSCWKDIKETAKSDYVTLCCTVCALQAVKCGQKRSWSEGDQTEAELPTKQRRSSAAAAAATKSISLDLQCNEKGTPIRLSVSMVGFNDDVDSGIEVPSHSDASEPADPVDSAPTEAEVRREQEKAEEDEVFVAGMQQITDGMEELQANLFKQLENLDLRDDPDFEAVCNDQAQPSAQTGVEGAPENDGNKEIMLRANLVTSANDHQGDKQAVNGRSCDTPKPEASSDDEGETDDTTSSSGDDDEQLYPHRCEAENFDVNRDASLSANFRQGSDDPNNRYYDSNVNQMAGVYSYVTSPTSVGQMLSSLS